MSTIPVSFRASPLPTDFSATPQEFLDAIVARLAIESPTTISFFVSGPTAPASNVGAWLKNGITWYTWSSSTAEYIPQVIESPSLKYIFQNGAPSNLQYVFWGNLDGSGKAQSIQYFNDGTWHDVYEDSFALYVKTPDMVTAIDSKITAALLPYSTTAQMNAAVTAAVGAQSFGKGAFKVGMNASQHQVIAVSDSGTMTPVFDYVFSDPDGCFAANKYTCPANGYYLFNVILEYNGDDSNVTDLGTILSVARGGVVLAGNAKQSEYDPAASMTQAITVGPHLLNMGDQISVSLTYTVTVTAPSGFIVGGGGSQLSQFSGIMLRSA